MINDADTDLLPDADLLRYCRTSSCPHRPEAAVPAAAKAIAPEPYPTEAVAPEPYPAEAAAPEPSHRQ
jgi:hypothetical protein